MTFATRAGALLAGAVTAFALSGPIAAADTPDDVFVMAKDISDIITLDPAEVFEFSGGEVITQLYEKVMAYPLDDLTRMVGGAVESWKVSEDGKTITFTMRPDNVFASGNPVRAEDVAYSLRRVIKLNKTPSFIFTQLGWTAENVDDLVKVVDGKVEITITTGLSPDLVLNTMAANVASVVDKKVVESHAVDGDMGYGWLQTHAAGSGPYTLVSWKANELVSFKVNPNYRGDAPAMKRVIIRHIPEPAAQRLLVEKGDVDLARDLTPDQVAALAGNDDLKVQSDLKGGLIYLAANQKNEILSNPKVMEALKYLINYQGMADSFLKGQYKVHQAAWPSTLWASYDKTPYSLDVEKAEKLLAEAGYPDGFEIRLSTLNESPYPQIAAAIQATLAKAGIKAEIRTAEGKTLWPMYRSRKHELIVARWGPDYLDPHSNIDSFVDNTDNSDAAKLTGVLAWRNAWQDKDMNAMVDAAARELDRATREQMYLDIQKKLQEIGPYAIMFQDMEQSVMDEDVKGFVSNIDGVYYRTITK